MSSGLLDLSFVANPVSNNIFRIKLYKSLQKLALVQNFSNTPTE